jgi:hypothetical protein
MEKPHENHGALHEFHHDPSSSKTEGILCKEMIATLGLRK